MLCFQSRFVTISKVLKDTLAPNMLSIFSHEKLKYPVMAKCAYGMTGGCFEMPSEIVPPKTGISCPDIIPIAFEVKPINKEAMLNESALVHPDVETSSRYILGTRFTS